MTKIPEAFLSTRRFSVERKPFAGHDTFLVTPALARREAMVEHLVTDAACVVALVDAPGAGKTALIERLRGRLGRRATCIRVEIGRVAGAEHVIRRLAIALGVRESASAATALTRMHAMLSEQSAAGRLTLVAIDDAHHLTLGALQTLVALAARWAGSGLRLLLGGRPALVPMLEDTGAGASIPIRLVDLPPLDREQVGDLIHLQLHDAGLHGDSPFTDRRIADIADRSSGRPGLVAPLALAQLREEATTGWRPGRLRALVIVGVAIAVAALAPLADRTLERLRALSLTAPAAVPAPGVQRVPGFESVLRPESADPSSG